MAYFTLFLGRGLTTSASGWLSSIKANKLKGTKSTTAAHARFKCEKQRHGAEHLRLNPIKTDMDALRFLGSPWRREASRKLQLIPVLVAPEQRTHLHLQVGCWRQLAHFCSSCLMERICVTLSVPAEAYGWRNDLHRKWKTPSATACTSIRQSRQSAQRVRQEIENFRVVPPRTRN